MPDIRKLGETSNRVRLILPLAGLVYNTSGLIVSTIADNEASATAYTEAASNIETITTLGTFAAPTTSKCRFKEVDATNHPYLYELQFADARFAVASSKRLIITVSGGGLTEPVHYEVEFTPSAIVDDIAAASANKIADHVKRRTQANVEASSDGDALSLASLYGLQQQAQKADGDTVPGTLTVYQTDGATVLGTKTLTGNVAATPVTKVV